MAAAHELHRRGCDAQIVFVTNMAQYAIRGYEVGAFDFVVKPVEYLVFAFKFKRVVEAARTGATAWSPCGLGVAAGWRFSAWRTPAWERSSWGRTAFPQPPRTTPTTMALACEASVTSPPATAAA